MTVLEVLNAVNANLKMITVSGEENLDRLLGSIRAIKQCIEAISKQPAKEEPEHADPDPE
jgi:hypothetical protein